MKLKFWGVRGSIPTFMSSESLMGRIQSVIERIKESDLKNQDSKQAFIMSLPEYLTSFVGGNTSCVQLAVNEDEIFVFDAGTGLRDLGKNISKSVKKILAIISIFEIRQAQLDIGCKNQPFTIRKDKKIRINGIRMSHLPSFDINLTYAKRIISRNVMKNNLC